MSYILDALKRAETERERGSVPGLHARQLASYDDLDLHTSPAWLWLIAAAALVLLTGGAGFWWWRTPGPSPSVSVNASATPPNAKAAVPEASAVVIGLPAAPALDQPAPTYAANPANPANPTSNAASIPPPVVAAQLAPRPALPKAAAPMAPISAAVAVPAAAAAPATAPLPTARLASPTVAPQQAVAKNTPAKVAASPAGSGVSLLSDLPEALRHQIPPLVISGAVYSDDPTQRLLLVNNQAFNQGNAVAPGVQLEEIKANGSIFNFQGTRFQLEQ
jgi:general secretion pathway protein B